MSNDKSGAAGGGQGELVQAAKPETAELRFVEGSTGALGDGRRGLGEGGPTYSPLPRPGAQAGAAAAREHQAAIGHGLDSRTQDHLGRQLKQMYQGLVEQPVPDKFIELLARLDREEQGSDRD